VLPLPLPHFNMWCSRSKRLSAMLLSLACHRPTAAAGILTIPARPSSGKTWAWGDQHESESGHLGTTPAALPHRNQLSWSTRDQMLREHGPLGTSLGPRPGPLVTRTPRTPPGWCIRDQVAREVDPLGTIRTQVLVPWGPRVLEHLARWLRGDQVKGQVGPLGTIFARNLVPRGPDPASSWSECQEGGSLVTRFRTGLVPQGPPTRKSWSPEDQPSMAARESGHVGTRWRAKLVP